MAGTQARPGDPLPRPRLKLNTYPCQPETKGMRTRFRASVLRYIFRTATALAAGRLKSAALTVSNTPDEEDSDALNLTLIVDADWDFISKLRYDILVKVSEWSEAWSEDEKEAYGRRIYVGLLPLTL